LAVIARHTISNHEGTKETKKRSYHLLTQIVLLQPIMSKATTDFGNQQACFSLRVLRACLVRLKATGYSTDPTDSLRKTAPGVLIRPGPRVS